MTPRQLAATSLRWLNDNDGLAANAPDYLRRVFANVGASGDGALVAIALRLLADGADEPTYPHRDTLTQWIAEHPAADQYVTALLRQRTPPASALELYQRVYRREVLEMRDAIRKDLAAEIARYS